jgi:transcriptional regulator with XRE-family HTH domain
MAAAGISQAELARRIGISQPSVSYLAKHGAKGSKHLRAICRELNADEAYLEGRSDDQTVAARKGDVDVHAVQVMIPLTLPPVERLEKGFRALLMASRHMNEAELARELAEQLPTLFAVMQRPPTTARKRSAPDEAPEDDYPARRRA